MLTDVRHFETHRPDLGPVADWIAEEGLIAYPTETVYGLGCLATEDAVARLRAAKGRDADKPVLVLVRSREAVSDLAWPSWAIELAEVFWPGAVTLVLRDPAGTFPEALLGPTGGIGVRVSPDPVVRALLDQVGAPLVSTSANASGRPSATTGTEVTEVLRTLGIEDSTWVLDAGELPTSAPSTVIDCTGDEPRVLREGAVPTGRLRCVLPGIGAAGQTGAAK